MKLSEIAEIVNGATPSSSHPEYYDGEIVWITPKDLSEHKSKYITKGELNITQEGFDSCSTHIIPPYNILMSSRAPIGLLAINSIECCTNQGFKNLVVDKDKVDVDYLYYYLRYHIKEIEALGTGTTFKEVSKAPLEKFDINLPPLKEQKQVASILSDIDRKIELNKSINANLEAMAKQLYDYWFVQFDFPDENGRPYKSSGGKMVWNEKLKREIPAIFLQSSITELGIYNSDYTANGSFAGLAENVSYNEGEPFAQLIRIVDFCNDFSDAKDKIWVNKHAYDYLSSCHLNGGEIIICNVGNAGATFRCPFLDRPMVLGPNGIVVNGGIYNNYLYMYYCSAIGQQQIKSISSGSIQLKFNKTNFRQLPILVPSNTQIEQFNTLFAPIYEQMTLKWKENRELMKQRDELLPLLMNGQVSITE